MADFASIDLETKSAVDLRKAGVFRYSESPTTDVWCLSWCLDDGPITTWLPGQPLPVALVEHIADGGACRAYNSMFESVLFENVLGPRYGWPTIKLSQWHCTMAQAAALSLPRSLDAVAAALRIPVQKDREGHSLMLRLCRPRSFAEDGSPIFWDDPVRLQRLVTYCEKDVAVERAIAKRLRPLSASERIVFLLDARINRRGVKLDRPLIAAAQKIVDVATKDLDRRMRTVTGGAVPKCTNVAKLTAWLAGRGVELPTITKEDENGDAEERPSLAKTAMRKLLADETLPPDAREAVQIREEAAKSSTAKLTAMENAVCADGRLRGAYLFYGTGPGRFSGKLVQPANLPKGTVPGVDAAVPDVLTGDCGRVDVLWGPSLSVISSLLRGCFIPEDEKRFLVVDYTAIQARITPWVAAEHWKVKAFRDYDAKLGPDLYKVAAGRIYGCDPNSVTKAQRQVGKVSELACGFQGGVHAFQTMAAIYGLEIDNDEADEIKNAWRESNPATVTLWRELENAAFDAVRRPGIVATAAQGRIRFTVRGDWLYLILPSGRPIAYAFPSIKERTTPWGDQKEQVHFWSVDSMTKQWVETSTYGGKLCENIAMGIERDILVAAMIRLENAGYGVAMHNYDEATCEVPIGSHHSVAEMVALMTQGESWSTGLPIAAAGEETLRYRKME